MSEMLNCSDLPSPSLPLNPARLSGFRPGEPSASSSSSAFRPAPGDNQQGAPAPYSRTPALSPESHQQGLPTLYNRAPAALPPDNQAAPGPYSRPPPASLYSSLQVGMLEKNCFIVFNFSGRRRGQGRDSHLPPWRNLSVASFWLQLAFSTNREVF